MGVKQLWALLREAGVVQTLAGKEDDCDIAKAVDGTAVAIDISIWLQQAQLQPKLGEVFQSPRARVLKVCFERCLQWLRFGCTPVAVLEGNYPQEKVAELQKRYIERGCGSFVHTNNGERGAFLQSLNRSIAALFDALGLPVVQAPGEAEAMCAALNCAGLVAGCATQDSDALLLGATRVYHTINLQIASKANEVQYCELATVRNWLGLASGGSDALLTLAYLVGGDYHRGGNNVGLKTAVYGVLYLLNGHQDDSDLLGRLECELQHWDPSILESIPSQCTGCKRCGHESNRKGPCRQHTKRNPCKKCPAPSQAHVDSDFICQAQLAVQPCQCSHHTRKSERDFLKMVEKLRATPGFVGEATRAQQAYRQQMRAADAAVQKLLEGGNLGGDGGLRWSRRPDMAQVHSALGCQGAGLPWNRRTVEKKLLMLLREWDASHPGQDALYMPKRIVKIAGSRCAMESADSWAYIVDWLKVGGDADDDVSDVEFDDAGKLLRRNNRGELIEVFSQPVGDAAGSDEAEPDLPSQGLSSQLHGHKTVAEIALAKKQANANSQGRRHVRMSLMRHHWPRLVADFESTLREAKAAAVAKAAKRAARERQKEAKQAFGAGKKQTTMDSFFQQKKVRPVQDGPAREPTGPTMLLGSPRCQDKAMTKPAVRQGAASSCSKGAAGNVAVGRQSSGATQATVQPVIVLDDSPLQPGNLLPQKDVAALQGASSASQIPTPEKHAETAALRLGNGAASWSNAGQTPAITGQSRSVAREQPEQLQAREQPKLDAAQSSPKAAINRSLPAAASSRGPDTPKIRWEQHDGMPGSSKTASQQFADDVPSSSSLQRLSTFDAMDLARPHDPDPVSEDERARQQMSSTFEARDHISPRELFHNPDPVSEDERIRQPDNPILEDEGVGQHYKRDGEYLDEWGYGGVSPGPGSTPEPDLDEGQLESAGIERGVQPPVEREESARPAQSTDTGRTTCTTNPSSPDKRLRSPSPEFYDAEQGSPRDARLLAVADGGGSPAKKQRTPVKTPCRPARRIAFQATCAQPAVQPSPPAPATDGSFEAVLSPDTGASPGAAEPGSRTAVSGRKKLQFGGSQPSRGSAAEGLQTPVLRRPLPRAGKQVRLQHLQSDPLNPVTLASPCAVVDLTQESPEI